FAPMRTISVSVYFFANAVVAGDFNGDGKLDLAVNNSRGVGVLFGNGDGTFQAERDSALSAAPAALATADFNADGHADLAAVHGAAVTVLFGKSDGTFQSAPDFPDGLFPTVIRAADFNNDGKPDLVTGDGGVVGPSLLVNAMPDACFACTNPLIPDGALCSDGSVCTAGDTCRNH